MVTKHTHNTHTHHSARWRDASTHSVNTQGVKRRIILCIRPLHPSSNNKVRLRSQRKRSTRSHTRRPRTGGDIHTHRLFPRGSQKNSYAFASRGERDAKWCGGGSRVAETSKTHTHIRSPPQVGTHGRTNKYSAGLPQDSRRRASGRQKGGGHVFKSEIWMCGVCGGREKRERE